MTKSILFVFLDYPPKSGPGSNRNYYLKQHFNQLGWQTKVLTMEVLEDESDNSLSDDNDIIRAFSRDSTKVFSIAGKYPKVIEVPDRWYLWIVPALLRGYKQSKISNFDFIYAGFPAYSSTIVGIILSKILKKPLILDLRDPFRFRYDPHNMPMHWLYKWLEKCAIKQSKYLLTTTKSCADLYQKLYPKFLSSCIHVIPNGYAREFHQKLEETKQKKDASPFILLHSGVLYEIGRNPEVLLNAIKLLIERGSIKKGKFKLIFRGANTWPDLIKKIAELQLTDYIEFKSRISYFEAIQEMRNVDANVLIQNSLFNLQIPSKLYDILALKKPILAVTDEQGALAKEMDYLGLPYFSSSIEKTATILSNIINENQPTILDNKLLSRNRYTMNKKLSQFLSDVLKHNEKK